MKSKEVLRILGVTRTTLCSYVNKGLIKVTKLPNGYYDYDDKSVYDFMGNNKRVNIAYCRVSTYKQKKDLERQINSVQKYCDSNDIKIDSTYSEISSGLDLDRDKFNIMLNEIFKYKVDNVIIYNRDRLTRLSFITLKNIFKQFKTSIIVISDMLNEKSDKNELFDELVSMMHYFSTREYSNRKNKKKSKKSI